ncbi:MAG: ketopantoate reductase family protein [Chthoniobacterales bacterium]
MARVLVVGAGAVGCYFGVQLQRGGNDVTFLARADHAIALNRDGLRFESGGKSDQVRVRVTDRPEAARDADLILLCVKSYDTAAAARELAPHLANNARIVSLQNGVANHEIFEGEAKRPALPAVVYVAAQMESSTHLLHNAAGNLVIGSPRAARAEDLEPLVRLFAAANIPCRVSDFIEGDLWEKLIINCAFNGISAAGHAKYGEMMNAPLLRESMAQIIREGVAVGSAIQVPLEFDAVKSATWKVGETMHAAISSTAQDLQRGKRTEIDFLNGHIVEVGKRVGVAASVNHAIYALVKLLESSR